MMQEGIDVSFFTYSGKYIGQIAAELSKIFFLDFPNINVKKTGIIGQAFIRFRMKYPMPRMLPKCVKLECARRKGISYVQAR